ncbi:hypothetical protein [Natronocalculus amylovorans]|uniref:Uncharacterized protein n=1 Tax=Natronocalculus amylovorans TaxID=2917812 RepID=A0AAE3G086_9EURY|nr:hypothetical protein [Natronocalculus amylovorans]MCL9817819.1 hypothetical protein [Natronocalculus amylovorans]
MNNIRRAVILAALTVAIFAIAFGGGYTVALFTAEQTVEGTFKTAESFEEITPEPPETTPAPEETTPEPPETTPTPEETTPKPPETTPAPEETTPEPPETTPTPEEATEDPQEPNGEQTSNYISHNVVS